MIIKKFYNKNYKINHHQLHTTIPTLLYKQIYQRLLDEMISTVREIDIA